MKEDLQSFEQPEGEVRLRQYAVQHHVESKGHGSTASEVKGLILIPAFAVARQIIGAQLRDC